LLFDAPLKTVTRTVRAEDVRRRLGVRGGLGAALEVRVMFGPPKGQNDVGGTHGKTRTCWRIAASIFTVLNDKQWMQYLVC
jgi:hypothetical protein